MKRREGKGGHASKREIYGIPRGGAKSEVKGQGSIDMLRPNEGEGEGPRENLGDRFITNI